MRNKQTHLALQAKQTSCQLCFSFKQQLKSCFAEAAKENRVHCGRRSNAAHSEEALPADKQSSHALNTMSKTTRFADSPAQQDSPTALPGGPLPATNSGIPTGARAQWWMVNRLAPALGGTNVLLLALAFTIIGLQVYSGLKVV